MVMNLGVSLGKQTTKITYSKEPGDNNHKVTV